MGKPKIGPAADKAKKEKIAKLESKVEDEMEASKAPLLEHLLELRTRLIRVLMAVAVAFLVCLFFAETIFEWLLIPYESAVADLEEKGLETNDLIFTQALGAFFVKLKVALFGAIVLSFPVLAYHVYRFVAPGLYKNERGAFLPYLFASPILFILGASVVFFFVFPVVLSFGLGQQFATDKTNVAPLLNVTDYLSLATTLFIVFGLSFQLPVLLSLIARAGLLTQDTLKRSRKYAIVGIAAFAAIASPPDPFSQLGLGIPLYILFEISIICVGFVEPKYGEET